MRDLRDKFVTLFVHGTDASEIAETAFVLPLMFMMLLGIFWFGQAFSLYGAITRAAQEGARAGAAPACSTCTPLTGAVQEQNAATAVKNALIASNLDPNLMQTPSPPPVTFCPNPPSPNCPATGGACVQLPIQLLKPAQGGGDCGVSVYFQYPFQSYLPFTSLNQQLIILTASAQVRMETR